VTDQDFCAYEDPSESLMFGGSRNWSCVDSHAGRGKVGGDAGTSQSAGPLLAARVMGEGFCAEDEATATMLKEPQKGPQAGIKPCLQFLEQPNASSRGHVCNPAGCEGVQPSSDEQTAEWKEGLPHPSTGCDSTEGDR
jgi:hypothetical protein